MSLPKLFFSFFFTPAGPRFSVFSENKVKLILVDFSTEELDFSAYIPRRKWKTWQAW